MIYIFIYFTSKATEIYRCIFILCKSLLQSSSSLFIGGSEVERAYIGSFESHHPSKRDFLTLNCYSPCHAKLQRLLYDYSHVLQLFHYYVDGWCRLHYTQVGFITYLFIRHTAPRYPCEFMFHKSSPLHSRNKPVIYCFSDLTRERVTWVRWLLIYDYFIITLHSCSL